MIVILIISQLVKVVLIRISKSFQSTQEFNTSIITQRIACVRMTEVNSMVLTYFTLYSCVYVSKLYALVCVISSQSVYYRIASILNARPEVLPVYVYLEI